MLLPSEGLAVVVAGKWWHDGSWVAGGSMVCCLLPARRDICCALQGRELQLPSFAFGFPLGEICLPPTPPALMMLPEEQSEAHLEQCCRGWWFHATWL